MSNSSCYILFSAVTVFKIQNKADNIVVAQVLQPKENIKKQ